MNNKNTVGTVLSAVDKFKRMKKQADKIEDTFARGRFILEELETYTNRELREIAAYVANNKTI